MTAAPDIKGWCPGALRPMASGDGLVVRIRPRMGRLTPTQAHAIAHAARTHGNGIIDLSARANLQLRGVTETSHPMLIEDLRAQGLVDPDIKTETLRNLIVTPFRTGLPADPTSPPKRGNGGGWHATETDTLAATLTAALARMPLLPAKFGFAIDTGRRPVLAQASADIRLERSDDGRLILRPDGHPFGKPVVDLALEAKALADWFIAQGGVTAGRGRMAALIAKGIVPPGCTLSPATPLPPPPPGLHPEGALVAIAFGQMHADTLHALADLNHDIRPTPWRMLFLVGATKLPGFSSRTPDRTPSRIPGLITDRDDPLLAITACTGAPACPQGLQETRTLARHLAPHLPPGRTLHVSGCAKGCAHPGRSDLTLTATPLGYDLIVNGAACDTPSLLGLAPQAISDHLKAPNAT